MTIPRNVYAKMSSVEDARNYARELCDEKREQHEAFLYKNLELACAERTAANGKFTELLWIRTTSHDRYVEAINEATAKLITTINMCKDAAIAAKAVHKIHDKRVQNYAEAIDIAEQLIAIADADTPPDAPSEIRIRVRELLVMKLCLLISDNKAPARANGGRGDPYSALIWDAMLGNNQKHITNEYVTVCVCVATGEILHTFPAVDNDSIPFVESDNEGVYDGKPARWFSYAKDLRKIP